MIDALVSGKLIKTPELRTGKTGNHYIQFLLSVHTGEEQPVIVSGIAFTETAERIAKLQKGDPLAVVGSLKPSEWADKTTGEPKHGLNITVNNSLSPYEIKKRKPTPDAPAKSGNGSHPFNDDIEI